MAQYQVFFHELVWREDLAKLDPAIQKKVFKSLLSKLSTNPLEFGKPLVGNLKGLFRLRIGEYRAIYSVNRQRITVLVLKIGFRRDMEVYVQMAKRMGLL